MDFQEKLATVIINWKHRIESLGMEAGYSFSTYLANELKYNSADDNWKNSKPDKSDFKPELIKATKSPFKELQSKSGNLFRSFLPRSKNTLSKTIVTESKVTLTVGSKLPYANIHEKGATFTATPKQIGWFLWASQMYNNKYFFALFLKAKLKRSFVIPARPYFFKAVAEFEKKGIKEVEQEFVNDLIQALT